MNRVMKVQHVNDKFLQKLTAVLDQQLNDAELHADTIANTLGMSKSTLNRKLKGMSKPCINEFVKLHRLKKARTLLSAGYKVSDVSQQVGFKNPAYFSVCFKKWHHKTPSLYSQTTQRFSAEST
jgi:AraC-like DNA-binding protein